MYSDGILWFTGQSSSPLVQLLQPASMYPFVSRNNSSMQTRTSSQLMNPSNGAADRGMEDSISASSPAVDRSMEEWYPPQNKDKVNITCKLHHYSTTCTMYDQVLSQELVYMSKIE